MSNTINVNIFDKTNVDLLNNIESTKGINSAEMALISILEAKEKTVNVLDYQADNRSKSIINESSNADYIGLNYEYAFCSDGIEYIKDIESLNSAVKSDIVVSINKVNRQANPINHIKDLLSIDASEYYIIFPCSNLYGMALTDSLRIEKLENESLFINNKYSHETVQKIANKFNMKVDIFANDNNDFALLSLVKEDQKDVTKESKTIPNKKKNK